ncbi:MAG: glucose-6-phosphate isomerase [Marinilabiliaceae bacterium]|nr:glucose-6-phosphate isomerase [Marinilabiliaceae bacterium]
MENLKIDISKVSGFVSDKAIDDYEQLANESLKALYKKSGKGSDFLGWVELPDTITDEFLSDVEATAASLKAKADYVVVVGIGGSYLGARAVIDALNNSFDWLQTKRENPVILYAGQNIGEDYTSELLNFLSDKSFAVVVISKSGTTTEPAIAFRLLKELVEEKFGKNGAKDRIVAITDASRGALRTLADQEGYKTYVIPDDVGGRYSVLTPVGLLPIAVAGFDIRQLVKGAVDMKGLTSPEVPFKENPASLYAATRNELYKNGKAIEIMVNYQPKLHFVTEWWKQLYGESEGKDNKGIFPAGVDFSTDLHSMGQWIQEGVRNIFETVLTIKTANETLKVPSDCANLDGLNFLAGKRIDEVNKMAELGTLIAHLDGGVPNIKIELPQLNEYYLGQMIYFYEIACGISGYILGVNPFDQPGVEAYKKNMFALLEKPGFEAETKAMRQRIK